MKLLLLSAIIGQINTQDTDNCKKSFAIKTLSQKYAEMQDDKDLRQYDQFCPYETDLEGHEAGNLTAQHSL